MVAGFSAAAGLGYQFGLDFSFLRHTVSLSCHVYMAIDLDGWPDIRGATESRAVSLFEIPVNGYIATGWHRRGNVSLVPVSPTIDSNLYDAIMTGNRH